MSRKGYTTFIRLKAKLEKKLAARATGENVIWHLAAHAGFYDIDGPGFMDGEEPIKRGTLPKDIVALKEIKRILDGCKMMMNTIPSCPADDKYEEIKPCDCGNTCAKCRSKLRIAK